MADWTNIPDTALDPDAPLTSDLAYAWRDNPIAISEGAVGAPYMRVGWHPYNGTAVGDGANGVIWSFAVNGSVAAIETPDFVDGYEYRLVFSDVSANVGSGGDLRLQVYRQTSGAYSGVVNIFAVSTGASFEGTVEVSRTKDVLRFHYGYGSIISGGGDSQSNVNTGTYPAFTHATAQKILKYRLSLSVGNFTAGSVYLYRRRVY